VAAESISSDTEIRPYPVVNFLGVGVDAVTYADLFRAVDVWTADKGGRSHHVACINAYNVALALSNPRLARIYNGADIAGPDGMPFVRWIRRTLKTSCDRIAAPDTILQLAQRARSSGYTFYLYGGDSDVVVRMKAFLEQRFPHIRIVGYLSPPFRAMTPEEDDAVCAAINQLKPDIVCVGLGTPKQDYWIEEHLYKIRGSVLIASGATFDFFGGRIKMAPEFIRRSGFEWLYRLFSKDFRRLWQRYTVYHGLFVWHFLLQVLGIKVRQHARWYRPPRPELRGSAAPAARGSALVENATPPAR
jgi:N-acetylglucosaminyldiphosphoundecaprenol N-acetyl-beta-D-mannosaminyltransferase